MGMLYTQSCGMPRVSVGALVFVGIDLPSKLPSVLDGCGLWWQDPCVAHREGYAGLPEEEDPLASGASSKPAGVGAAGIPTAGAAAPAGASMESAEQHLGNNAESSQGAAKPATRTGVEGAVKSTVAASTEQAGSTRQ